MLESIACKQSRKQEWKSIHSKTMQVFQLIYQNIVDELHNIVGSHYKIIRKSETYLVSFSGNSFQQYLNVEQIMLEQKV